MKCIGIRKEDKYEMERRVPLTPKHVERLIKQYKLKVIVQSSDKRVFRDDEFVRAGAEVKEDLKECPVIFGIKEIPEIVFEPGKTYIFFAHVIKGQSFNMPMLKRMMELKCNLIDYERVADELGRRLIFFGRYAGMAGMINTFWSLGKRLKYFGQQSPFENLKQAHEYDTLEEAKDAISAVGRNIAEKGLPKYMTPLTIGFTGYGNVSSGAQELCGLLPVMEIKPEELEGLQKNKHSSENLIYKAIFREEDMMETVDKNNEFDLQEYYCNPSKYISKFDKYVPFLTAVVNCVYWDKRYPRVITKAYLRSLQKAASVQSQPKLTVIGDISCDIEGSVECTMKSAKIENPVYVYNPESGEITYGFEGEGILDMAVDILPSELPKASSKGFGDILYDFVNPIS